MISLSPPRVDRLERRQIIRRPLEEVFDFFARPGNLARITPPWLDFRIITPEPIPMSAGSLIDYTIRVMGLRVRWTTLIVDYNPPLSFIDQQLRGPYGYWRHRHEFEAVPEGVAMTDRVDYIVPFGLLGAPARILYVRPTLEKIFDYRAAAVERELAG